MPDLDQLLDGARHDVAHAAAYAAVVPDYRSIARRGQKRRNTKYGLLAGAAALAVVGAVGVTQIGGGGGSNEPGPVERPSPTVTDPVRAVEGDHPIVDGAGARPVAVAVSPGDPETMAVVWERGAKRAVVVTDDGFATRRVVRTLPITSLYAGPDGSFVVVEGWRADSLRIVDAGGRDEVVRDSGAEAPLAEGELAVVTGRPGVDRGVLAVDVSTGDAHPVPVPDGVHQLWVHGGRLMGLGGGSAEMSYHWDDDGGATWQDADLAVNPGALGVVVPGPAGGPHAIIESSYRGAAPYPVVSVQHATASEVWSLKYIGDGSVTFSSAFHYGDEVRFFGTVWDEQGTEAVDHGLFRIAEGETRFVPSEDIEKVSTSRPDVTDLQDVPIVGLENADGPVIWIPGVPGQGSVWRSADGGVTWEEHAAR